mmetsp:Transcript_117134/g.331916  ORF Transcript_117134/g.331916 Transcript_117134/m.331916 type:complete len:466 (-) Transcript_117134:591-1988(-)
MKAFVFATTSASTPSISRATSRADRSLAALAAAATRSRRPWSTAAFVRRLPSSMCTKLLRGPSSMSVSPLASVALTTAAPAASLPASASVSASVAARCRSPADGCGTAPAANCLDVASTPMAVCPTATRLASSSSKIACSSFFLASSSSCRFFSSSCLARSFSSSSRRRSRALTSDFMIATMPRMRWDFSTGTPSPSAMALKILSRCSSAGSNSYSSLANVATSARLSFPSPSASYFRNRSFCSLSFFIAAACRPARSFVLFAVSRMPEMVRRWAASVLNRGWNSDFKVLTAVAVLPISCFLAVSRADTWSRATFAADAAFSATSAASISPSGVAVSDVSVIAGAALAALTTLSPTSPTAFEAAKAMVSTCNFSACLFSSSTFFRSPSSASAFFLLSASSISLSSSSKRRLLASSTRAFACSMALFDSCMTFSIWDPILSRCSAVTFSSSTRSSSKFSGVAIRRR